MLASKKCEFCDKRGLPLLLVRDAVVPARSGAPETTSTYTTKPGRDGTAIS